MSRTVRLSILSLAAVLLAWTAVPSVTYAAPDPDKQVPAAPGVSKGDSDGDRISDDLEAALAELAPGDRVPVIVQGGSVASARRTAPSFTTKEEFTIIPAFAGSVTAGQVVALSHIPSVTRVELDGVTEAVDASGEADYGVAAARSAYTGVGALDGSGVGICIIDTGIDPAHEQFTGTRVIAWKDWVNNRTTPYDDHGHGTHVAGTAAGDSVGSTNNAPLYGGVARAADLAIAKVLNSSGSGSDSNVVSAIQWCAGQSGVDVISMSLGSPTSDGSDAGSQAVDAATAAGKVVVVAAGNSGDGPGTISSPGVATTAITVGAGADYSALGTSLDTDNGLYLADFSGRGPTTNPAASLKPDVVAPGMSVGSAKAGTTTSYVSYSGTSMATPFVAGVVALGLEANPDASPAQIKAALQSSAQDAGADGPDNEWGHGLVDARAFLAELGAATAGDAAWPDRASITGSVAAGATKNFTFDVTTAGEPLGISLQTTNGAATCVLPFGNSCWYGYEWSPDLDAYLVNPSGSVVASSRCMLESSNGNCAAPGRFETLGIANAVAGTWTLRVESFSGTGTFAATVFGAMGMVTPPPPDPEPTAPAAPSELSATVISDTEIDLAWTVNSSDETGFEIERCTGDPCGFSTVTTVGANTATWSDADLTAETGYTYRVRAVNDVGPSDYSNVASATTDAPPPPPVQSAPAAPTGLTATAIARNKVSLAWTDNSDNETGFRIERCTGRTCTNFTTVGTVGDGVTTFSDTGLSARTTYRYRVAAFNDAGDSAYSNIVKVTTRR